MRNIRAPHLLSGVLLLAFLSSSVVSPAQKSNCESLQRQKSSTYGFHPAKLTGAQRTQKSAEMDRFWDAVKTAGPSGTACLKTMLSNEHGDGFFLFDAAALLEGLDPSGKSDELIADAVAHSDLDDVDVKDYLRTALRLSHKGIDIGPIAHNYMLHPNVTVYLPEHGAYEVDKTTGAIMLYGSMKPELVDRYLAQEVTSNSQETRDAAAIVWSMNLTETSYKGIVALGAMENFSQNARDSVASVRKIKQVKTTVPAKYSRQQMLDKLAKLPEMDANIDGAEDKALDNSIYVNLRSEDLPAFRDARRRMIGGVSNESVEGYAELSRILLNFINKLDLYKEYRTP